MKHILTICGVAALALAGCGSDDEPTTASGTGAVEISAPWARPSAATQTQGAIYMQLEASEADTLVAASVPASVAGETQIHEVIPVDGTDTAMDMSGDAMSGDVTSGEMSGEMQMRMQELEDGLTLPAGEVVTLEPGGYHVMLLDLVEPLTVGDEIELTLEFENADSTIVTVEVDESAP